MGEVGLDKIRGGIFDCVGGIERGVPTQFAGAPPRTSGAGAGHPRISHLYGATRSPPSALAGSSAFWNLFFLDRERGPLFPDD
jgi:hypothetical protein